MAFKPVTKSDEDGNSWLQHVTQLFGLLAGLVTIVYLTGGVVMALRLGFQDLPWGNVVSQLPREFLISLGAGQVLLPSLFVGLLYGLYRLARNARPDVPVAYRLQDGWTARSVLGARYLLTFVLLFAPLVLASVLPARTEAQNEIPLEFLAVAAVLFVLVVIAVQEVRALIVQQCNWLPQRWNSVRVVVILAAVYSATAIPATMFAAAAFPLTPARVCTVDNFSENGFLVGETSDRVYLGEESDDRRIAVIPFSKVGELFIGRNASDSTCEIVSAPPPAAERQKIEENLKKGISGSFLLPENQTTEPPR